MDAGFAVLPGDVIAAAFGDERALLVVSVVGVTSFTGVKLFDERIGLAATDVSDGCFGASCTATAVSPHFGTPFLFVLVGCAELGSGCRTWFASR